MSIQEYVCIRMYMQRMLMNIHEHIIILITMHEYPCICSEYSWISMFIPVYLWIFMNMHAYAARNYEYSWTSVNSPEYSYAADINDYSLKFDHIREFSMYTQRIFIHIHDDSTCFPSYWQRSLVYSFVYLPTCF